MRFIMKTAKNVALKCYKASHFLYFKNYFLCAMKKHFKFPIRCNQAID